MQAPLEQGQQVGSLAISYQDQQIIEVPLVVRDQVESAGFFSRFWDGVKLFLMKLFGKF